MIEGQQVKGEIKYRVQKNTTINGYCDYANSL